MAKSKPKFHIGTSGFHYEHWRGVFYPRDLDKSAWLEYYARSFGTVELNSTFYHLPQAKTVADWVKKTPSGFRYAVKAPRTITHLKSLKGVREPLAAFYKLADAFQEKLGPVLFQLPPVLEKDDALLKDFLKQLKKKYKNVIEFRHPSWWDEETFALLSERGVAFGMSGLPGQPLLVKYTAPFAYLRLHSDESLKRRAYPREKILELTAKLTPVFLKVKEIYIYFNNDLDGQAVQDARTLIEILSSRYGSPQ